MGTPIAMQIVTAATATSRMNLPPKMIVLSRTRPYWSVPNGNCALGGELAGPRPIWVGSCGESQGAKTLIIIVKSVTTIPTTMSDRPDPLDSNGESSLPNAEWELVSVIGESSGRGTRKECRLEG